LLVPQGISFVLTIALAFGEHEDIAEPYDIQKAADPVFSDHSKISMT